jgi:hypothetical protein
MLGKSGVFGGIRIGTETDKFGENLPQCNFVHHKSHIAGTVVEPGQPPWKVGD